MQKLESMGLGKVGRIDKENPGKFGPSNIPKETRDEMWFTKYGAQTNDTNALVVFKKLSPPVGSVIEMQQLSDKLAGVGSGRCCNRTCACVLVFDL